MSLQAFYFALLASSRLVGADYVAAENNYVTNDPFRTTDSGRYTECPVDVWDRQKDLLPQKSQSGKQFKQTVSADYSLLWDITYHKSHKILKNKFTTQCFVLNQCGVRPPEADDVPDGCKFVTVPISKSAVDSTTYLPFIEVLGERRSLKVLATSFNYVSSPCLKKMYKQGMIEQANEYWPDNDDVDEILKSEGVQTTFTSNYPADIFQTNPDGVKHNGYLMTDINERGKDTAVLQAAEYVEAAGAFFNREKEATEAIERVIDNYQCTKKAVEKALGTRERVKVLVSAYSSWSSAWSAGEKGTYYDEMVTAAGGKLIGTGPQYSTWTTEEIKDIAQDADVWISLGEWGEGQPWSEMEDVPCVKAGRLFDNMRRGTNAWFEEKALQPDALLQDIALTTFPGAVAGLRHTWLRDIKAGDKIRKPEDDDCPDIDAPYEWLGVDACGGSDSIEPVEGKCPKRGLEKVDKDDCPKELNLGNCDDEDLEAGDFCEGDGECGTDPDLDNCSNKDDKDMDIYRVRGKESSSSSSSSEEASSEDSEESEESSEESESSEASSEASEGSEESEEESEEEESAEEAPEAKPGCPANVLKPVENCPRKPGLLLRCNQGANLVEGQMCRAKGGECETDRDLGNCRRGELNVYEVTGDKVPKFCPQERLGAELVPVTSECSAQGPPGALPRCNDGQLFHDDYCRAKGECGTRETLGNCRNGELNVYQVKVPKICPKKLAEVAPADCPEKPGLLPRCHFGGLLAKGQMCRAKGECRTDKALGNCRNGELSVFKVEKEAAQRVPAP